MQGRCIQRDARCDADWTLEKCDQGSLAFVFQAAQLFHFCEHDWYLYDKHRWTMLNYVKRNCLHFVYTEYFVCRRFLELEAHYNLHNLQNQPWDQIQILLQSATVLLATSLLWSQTPIERAVIWCENAGTSNFLWVQNWYTWDRLTFVSTFSPWNPLRHGARRPKSWGRPALAAAAAFTGAVTLRLSKSRIVTPLLPSEM